MSFMPLLHLFTRRAGIDDITSQSKKRLIDSSSIVNSAVEKAKQKRQKEIEKVQREIDAENEILSSVSNALGKLTEQTTYTELRPSYTEGRVETNEGTIGARSGVVTIRLRYSTHQFSGDFNRQVDIKISGINKKRLTLTKAGGYGRDEKVLAKATVDEVLVYVVEQLMKFGLMKEQSEQA